MPDFLLGGGYLTNAIYIISISKEYQNHGLPIDRYRGTKQGGEMKDGVCAEGGVGVECGFRTCSSVFGTLGKDGP